MSLNPQSIIMDDSATVVSTLTTGDDAFTVTSTVKKSYWRFLGLFRTMEEQQQEDQHVTAQEIHGQLLALLTELDQVIKALKKQAVAVTGKISSKTALLQSIVPLEEEKESALSAAEESNNKQRSIATRKKIDRLEEDRKRILLALEYLQTLRIQVRLCADDVLEEMEHPPVDNDQELSFDAGKLLDALPTMPEIADTVESILYERKSSWAESVQRVVELVTQGSLLSAAALNSSSKPPAKNPLSQEESSEFLAIPPGLGLKKPEPETSNDKQNQDNPHASSSRQYFYD